MIKCSEVRKIYRYTDEDKGSGPAFTRFWTFQMLTLQISEERLISLLGQMNEQSAKSSKVTVQRRRRVWEEDDEDEEL